MSRCSARLGLVLFVWFAVACTADGGTDTTSETRDPILDATVRLPDDLAVGDCVRLQADPPDAMNVTLTDCSADASMPVIAIVELDDGPYPGPEAMRSRADSQCGDAFEATGMTVGDGQAAWGQTQPTPGDWQRGERRIVCYGPP